MATPFIALHDIQCVYPLSPQYCTTPRVFYYVVLAAAVLARRHVWLAAGAAASVMTYGGTAAVHAVVLACVRGSSTSLLPASDVWLHESQDRVTAAVRGLVLDLDVHATLAIVGAGFLMLLPLATSSETFRKSEAKPILVAWGLLMLVGTICCLVELFAIDTTAQGPFHQTRFCPAGHNDSLPLLSVAGSGLEDTWNASVWSFFASGLEGRPGCFYPCGYSTQILRSQADIEVISHPDIRPGTSKSIALRVLPTFVAVCVPLNTLAGLALLWNSRRQSTRPIASDAVADEPFTREHIPRFFPTTIRAYSALVAPLMATLFVVLAEFDLASDPQSESLHHFGQWQRVMAVLLVLVAALLGKYSERIRRCVFREKTHARGDAKGERKMADEVRLVPTMQYQTTRSAWGRLN